MAIDTRDKLINALGNNNTRLIIDKASLANQTAGVYCSMWRATGQPGQGAIPTVVAAVNNTTLGTFNFAQQTLPAASYIGYLDVVTSISATSLEIHDRLAHKGGLVGNVATVQAVDLDLGLLLATNNIAARKGDADYSDVSWWLEWYTDTGPTACTATVAVTYNDNSTGNLTGISLAATRRAGNMYGLNVLVPAAKSGLFIKKVNTVTLSVSTGTAGNFGVTATRVRAAIGSPLANFKSVADWAQLGFPRIENEAGLFLVVLSGASLSGTVRGGGKILHGQYMAHVGEPQADLPSDLLGRRITGGQDLGTAEWLVSDDFFESPSISGVQLNYWNGSTYVAVTLKRYNGTIWQDCSIKVFKGSMWE